MTRIDLELQAEKYKKGLIGLGAFMSAVDAYSSASNNGNAIVSGALPLVSRDELISSLDDKRICKMSDLPARIYYLSRKETADYLMDKYVITKRQ